MKTNRETLRMKKTKKSPGKPRGLKSSSKKLSSNLTGIEALESALPVSKAHPILHRYFGFCMYKAAMRFRGMMDEALVDYNLVTPQLGIMRVVNEAGSVSQQDIGDFVVIDKASMVKFIDQLEKLKLVSRKSHETDRRIKLISLTAKGKKTLEIVAEIRKKVEAIFLQPLTSEEQDQLRAIVPKLLL